VQDPVLQAPLAAPAGGTVQVRVADSKVTEVFVSGPDSPPPSRYAVSPNGKVEIPVPNAAGETLTVMVSLGERILTADIDIVAPSS
jgi:hypothetical protein